MVTANLAIMHLALKRCLERDTVLQSLNNIIYIKYSTVQNLCFNFIFSHKRFYVF